MARVRQKMAKNGAGGASNRGGQAAKQRNKHKVVLEDTSNEKTKLQSVVTFRANPPPGYTFIPAGNPELTAALKEFARRGDNKIYAVTTTPHADRHELSREVHRVGFHFPTNVVAQVCAHYGIRLTSAGKVIDDSKDDKLFKQVYQNGQRPVEEEEEKEKDQITINTEAKQTIKDLFPNIPDKDLFQIIKTAFQKGDNRVGTADEIPLVRRAQLSVVAHIRHMYTQYDKLLRKVPYNDARHMVEQDTLKKLIEWRGDEDTTDEATQRAADDLLREVIVISDEGSDSGSDDVQQVPQDNIHVEELPSAAYAESSKRPRSPLSRAHHEDANQGYPFLPREVRRYRPSDDEIAQRDRSRYAVWDQAKRDYRSRIPQHSVTAMDGNYEQERSTSRILIPLDSHPYPIRTQEAPIPSTRMEYEALPVRQPSPPTYIRGADGTLYERVAMRPPAFDPNRATRHEERAPAATLQPAMRVKPRPSSPQGYSYRDHRHAGNTEVGNGTVLPSIEGPDGTYLSPRTRQNTFNDHLQARETNIARDESRVVRGVAPIDWTGDVDQSSKRRRLEEVSRVPEYRVTRRDSPEGRREPVYVSHSHQPAQSSAQARVFDYGEPRSSPRTRPTAPALEPVRYIERYPVYDIYDPLPSGSSVSQPTSAVYGRHEMLNRQSRYPAQSHDSGRSVEFETSIPKRVEQPLAEPARRVYEPIFDPRGYENQHAMQRNGAVREHPADAFPPDSRTRHTYHSGSIVHETLGELPHQRVPEYDYRRAATAGHYAHVDH